MKVKVSLLAASLLASVACFAAETYQVSTSFFKNGELVAAPMLIVEADQTASFTLGDDFSYNLTITPKQDQTVGVATAVTFGSDTITPSFILAYDKEASMEIGDKKLTLLVSKVGS
ncbi:hypothetical protein [Rheinheimera sp. 1928-s]|uniref:hypothetical protein n=1 Tax=Rheinheimera sp. 1928-s TaxID=3033803 RepID=UPI00262D9DDA|nr:hypothetical protein [Rheinheimera sp. 1928-s]MDF3126785.1 hypothetical protein [Rheinheimera sp. 1928-s]